MKLLLIQPPICDFYDTEIRLQPLGLCMLKAAVKKEMPWVDVIVKDYHQGHGRKTMSYPSELSYLRAYYAFHDAGPFSMFHHFYHFGATFEDIANDVAQENPDMVGISSLFTPYAREGLACAKAIKQYLNIPIVMGGPHVTTQPLDMLKDPNVDFVIRGEGERPLVELLRTLESHGALHHVPNLGFKNDGETILNPMGTPYDFENLPWSDFSDFPIDRYVFKKRPLCFIMTTRGCSHQCTFCSVHQTFGKSLRRRTVEDIAEEIKHRYDQGYRVFDFEDDNLTFHKTDFMNLLSRLQVEIPLKDVRFSAMNGISYMSLDKEILERMKTVGFKSLNLSVVTANAEILSRVHRPHTIDKFLDIVRQAYELEMDMVCYQILGLPYEGLEDMITTIRLLATLPILIGVSIFYLVPGCAMASEFGSITPEDWTRCRSTAMTIESGHVSRDDVYTLFITARIINFLKGFRFEKNEISIEEALDQIVELGKRELAGVEILRRLFNERVLYAATHKSYRPLPRFKTDLFFNVWEGMTHIVTQKGGRINLA